MTETTAKIIPLARTIALSALVASSVSGSLRAQSPLWGDLRPGPHAVGFAIIKAYDHTRIARAKTAESGEATVGERAYPLVIEYWYPARIAGGAARLTFEQYQRLGALDAQLRPPGPEAIAAANRDLKAFYERPQNFPFGTVSDDSWQRLMRTPLAAAADAPPVAGPFPLVAGVGGAQGNSVLGEYLASHGYVAALVHSPVFLDLPPAARMEWYVRDLEFAVSKMRTLPQVDRDRLATWGFSFAGMPALLLAMRHPDVDAVASLESALFGEPFASTQLKVNTFYDPARLRVPFLHMMRAQLSRESEQLADFDALRYSLRYRYLLNDTTLVHQDFGTHGIAAAAVLDKRPVALDAVRRALGANTEFVRRFLDAHVKRDRAALAYLESPPEALVSGRGFLTVERREPVRPAPTQAELVAMVSRDGVARAIEAFREARRSDPLAPLFREATVNGMAYQLLRGGNPSAALELFKLNVELFPQSANAHDSLAEAYEAGGQSSLAAQNARKVLDLLEADQTLTPSAKTNLQTINTERLKRLGAS